MTAIKICGITRRHDAEAAVEFGADALGFVLWPGSPRYTDANSAGAIIRNLPPFVTPVGVFVSPTSDDVARAADAGLRIAQIHGEVPSWAGGRGPIPVLRAVHLGAGPPETIAPTIDDTTVLLDATDPVRHGGTGQTVNWTRARAVAARRRVVLAGGLTPANVREAIQTVRPYAVDVASGVEAAPGVKDHDLLRRFVQTAKETV